MIFSITNQMQTHNNIDFSTHMCYNNLRTKTRQWSRFTLGGGAALFVLCREEGSSVSYRILLIDSTGTGMQELLGQPVWSECGFEIAGRTADAVSAVSTLVQQDFDALLCIHRPSEQTAVELLIRMQRKALAAPVIVISMADDSPCMRQCFLYGATDFLIDPPSDDDLRIALKRAAQQLDCRLIHQEYHAALDLAVGSLQAKGVSDALTGKLRELMLVSIESTVTTESAAEFFGFNRDYFSRYFKAKTGITFSEFHKGFVMEYAKLLLSGGHFKVQEVTEILGFSSADYFTRIFKRHTGKTPSEFKKL